jgi:hypothetical protein
MDAPATRESDERILQWLRARHDGIGPRQLARELRVSWAAINAATYKVRAADIAESGEPPASVRSAYW